MCPEECMISKPYIILVVKILHTHTHTILSLGVYCPQAVGAVVKMCLTCAHKWRIRITCQLPIVIGSLINFHEQVCLFQRTSWENYSVVLLLHCVMTSLECISTQCHGISSRNSQTKLQVEKPVFNLCVFLNCLV